MKGRPKKGGFKGTPAKAPTTYADVVKTTSIRNTSLITSNYHFPMGLLNDGENVCFLNSVVQTLYNIPEVRNYVLCATRSSVPFLTIQNLVHAIYNAPAPVDSFDMH